LEVFSILPNQIERIQSVEEKENYVLECIKRMIDSDIHKIEKNQENRKKLQMMDDIRIKNKYPKKISRVLTWLNLDRTHK